MLQVKIADGSGWSSSQEVALGKNFTPRLELPIPPERIRCWQPADPFLYDIEISLLDPQGYLVDRAKELRRAAQRCH